MSVIIADAANNSYTTGALSTVNGFYRCEAFNLGPFGSSNVLALSTERDIPVTFANAGNCQGVILMLKAQNATTMKGVRVALQENVATVWTDRAVVTYTSAQMHGLSNETVQLQNFDFWIVPFTGGTFPYPVTTAGGTWRFAVTSSGAGALDWNIRTSDNTNFTFITWCDNKVSFVSGSDCVVAKDPILIDMTARFQGVLPTGDAVRSVCAITCSATTPAAVPKLLWENPPAASYTLTLDGLVLFGPHSGFRIGTAASPIPANKQAIINIVAATLGTATQTGFSSPALAAGSAFYKSNFWFYGEVPVTEDALLALDAAAGATSIVLQQAPTGWSVNDPIFIGGQYVQGLGDHAFNSILSVVSTTVNLNEPIVANLRRAGGAVIRFAGYGIKIVAPAATAVSQTVGCPTNVQMQGVQCDFNVFNFSTMPNSGINDDPSYMEAVGTFISHCASRGNTIALGGNLWMQSLPVTTQPFLVDSVNVVNLGMASFGNRTPISTRLITVTNCINSTLGPTSSANGVSVGAASGVQTKIVVMNNTWENSLGAFLSFSGAEVVVTGNKFWGCGNSTAAANFANCLLSTYASNSFDYCAVAAVHSSSVWCVDSFSTFGLRGTNTVDISYLSGTPIPTSYVSIVSPRAGSLTLSGTATHGNTGNLGLNNFLSFTNYPSGVPFDDRIYSGVGNYQRTGSGLPDATARTSGYALRLEPFFGSVPQLWPIGADSRVIPTGNLLGRPLTVSGWVMMGTTAFFAGTHINPFLSVRYDGTATGTSQAINAAGTWQQLAVTVTPTTSTPFVEAFFSGATDALGSASYFYIDDLSVTMPQGAGVNTGSLDVWAYGRPVWPPSNAFQASSTALSTLAATVAPFAATETDLYVVPANATSCVISSLLVCNRGAAPTSFRIAVVPSGGVTATRDYLYYDVPIGGNDTFAATVGLTPAALAVLRVYAGSANLSFSIWGSLVS